MLYELCVRSGARVDFNSEVCEVDLEEPGLLLGSGEIVKADFIVGADGARGISRRTLVGFEESLNPAPLAGYT